MLSSSIYSCRNSLKNAQLSINPMKIGIIGNSIACGQMASTQAGQLFDYNTMLNSHYAASITGTYSASMLTSFEAHSPVEGWANQLLEYLLSVNKSYQVVNLCGSGWDSGDQLGEYSVKSGKLPVNNNVDVFANMLDRPKYVLIALQVNDWGHGQGLAFFENNTKRIIQKLKNANIEPIMVLESPVYNKDSMTVEDNYNLDTVNFSGGYKFTESARNIAVQYDLMIIDFFTPIDQIAKNLSGSSYGEKLAQTNLYYDMIQNMPVHPNQAGHNLMANIAIDFFKNQKIIQETAN